MVTSVDPWLGWTAVSIGPLSFIGICVVYFNLDKRYARKEEVAASRDSLEKVRKEMTEGFAGITKTAAEQFVSLTRDVATLQGRLAGAAGIDRSV